MTAARGRRKLSMARHPSTAPRLPEFLKRSSFWSRVSTFCCESSLAHVLCYIVTMGVLRHHRHAHHHHRHHHEQDGHGSVVAASEDDDDEKEHHRSTTRHHRRARRSSTLTDIERRSSTSSLHRHHHHHHHDDNDKPPSLRHHPTLTSLERKLTDAERNVGRTLTNVEHTAETTVSEIAGLDDVDPRPISSFLHEAAHLNFYRVHLLIFTFTPLIFSGIFYASNGPSPENQIAYVDALFMCTSAMAVTGLNSVLLADLTTWQQFIIFVRSVSVLVGERSPLVQRRVADLLVECVSLLTSSSRRSGRLHSCPSSSSVFEGAFSLLA